MKKYRQQLLDLERSLDSPGHATLPLVLQSHPLVLQWPHATLPLFASDPTQHFLWYSSDLTWHSLHDPTSGPPVTPQGASSGPQKKRSSSLSQLISHVLWSSIRRIYEDWECGLWFCKLLLLSVVCWLLYFELYIPIHDIARHALVS